MARGLFHTSPTLDFTVAINHKISSSDGVPHVLATDIGDNFTDQKVEGWLKSAEFCRVLKPPRHPQPNTLAEDFVGKIKGSIKSITACKVDEHGRRADNFSMQYSNSVHATTATVQQSHSKIAYFERTYCSCSPPKSTSVEITN